MKTIIALLAFATILAANNMAAGTITFETYDLLGAYHSDGLYNLNGLGTWNGQSVSPTNMPTDFERQLASSINFFAVPAQPNVLFVQVTDVVATHFGSAFGSAFNNITQTGVRFTVPLHGGGILGAPSLSLDYANPGEIRAFAPPDYSTEPLTTTPGFGLTGSGQNQFLIQTLSGADNGFINSNWGVYGSNSRILGGGVFQLIFPNGTDVFQEFDFTEATVEAQYGAGSQYILAMLVPEPSTLTLTGFTIAAIMILRGRKKRENVVAD